MRAYEFLTEEQLDEINRREFLKKAGMATMGAALGTAAVDQGAHAAGGSWSFSHDVDEFEGREAWAARSGAVKLIVTFSKDANGRFYLNLSFLSPEYVGEGKAEFFLKIDNGKVHKYNLTNVIKGNYGIIDIAQNDPILNEIMNGSVAKMRVRGSYATEDFQESLSGSTKAITSVLNAIPKPEPVDTTPRYSISDEQVKQIEQLVSQFKEMGDMKTAKQYQDLLDGYRTN